MSLNDVKVQLIRDCLEQGLNIKKTAQVVGVNRKTVYRYLNIINKERVSQGLQELARAYSRPVKDHKSSCQYPIERNNTESKYRVSVYGVEITCDSAQSVAELIQHLTESGLNSKAKDKPKSKKSQGLCSEYRCFQGQGLTERCGDGGPGTERAGPGPKTKQLHKIESHLAGGIGETPGRATPPMPGFSKTLAKHNMDSFPDSNNSGIFLKGVAKHNMDFCSILNSTGNFLKDSGKRDTIYLGKFGKDSGKHNMEFRHVSTPAKRSREEIVALLKEKHERAERILSTVGPERTRRKVAVRPVVVINHHHNGGSFRSV